MPPRIRSIVACWATPARVVAHRRSGGGRRRLEGRRIRVVSGGRTHSHAAARPRVESDAGDGLESVQSRFQGQQVRNVRRPSVLPLDDVVDLRPARYAGGDEGGCFVVEPVPQREPASLVGRRPVSGAVQVQVRRACRVCQHPSECGRVPQCEARRAGGDGPVPEQFRNLPAASINRNGCTCAAPPPAVASPAASVPVPSPVNQRVTRSARSWSRVLVSPGRWRDRRASAVIRSSAQAMSVIGAYTWSQPIASPAGSTVIRRRRRAASWRSCSVSVHNRSRNRRARRANSPGRKRSATAASLSS